MFDGTLPASLDEKKPCSRRPTPLLLLLLRLSAERVSETSACVASALLFLVGWEAELPGRRAGGGAEGRGAEGGEDA